MTVWFIIRLLYVHLINKQQSVCSLCLCVSFSFIHTHADRQWVRRCYNVFNRASLCFFIMWSSWVEAGLSLAPAPRGFLPTAEQQRQRGRRQTQQTNTSFGQNQRGLDSCFLRRLRKNRLTRCFAVRSTGSPSRVITKYTQTHASTHSAKMIRLDKCFYLQSC